MFARGKDVLAWVDEDYLRAAFLVRSTIIPRVKGRIKWEIVKIYDAGYLW